jgi:DtxR family Mn-dependent transcriptional regulator
MTESVDNYLKAIYELQEAHGRVTTTALAERLAIAAPSVTAMLKRLHEMQPAQVKYARHQGAVLTDAGRRRALEIIRHHRLIETFLHRVLQFNWDEVHEEAEKLEHYISERLEDRIAEFLGHPQYDPHGAPIPGKDGALPREIFVPLTDLAQGDAARVVRVNRGPDGLQDYTSGLGIIPGAHVTLETRAPFDGPFSVAVGEGKGLTRHALGATVAGHIIVDPEQA